MLAVYAFVFAVIFQARGASTSPYALFLFSGLLPWNWLSSALTDAASSITTHGALLRKILFPAEVLPPVAFVARVILFLSALTVHFRDMKDLLATALSLWIFTTQVLYALSYVKQERVR